MDIFNEEKTTISNKQMNEIERDFQSELNKTEFETNEKTTSEPKNQSSGINQEIPLPKICGEIPMAFISSFIHEKRIQKFVPTDFKEEARNVIKPTEKQIDNSTQIVQFFADRYLPAILSNPFATPILLAGGIAKIEYTKYVLLTDIINKSNGEKVA
jgi:hypothetical protein